MESSVNIIGFDPGIKNVGWGVYLHGRWLSGVRIIQGNMADRAECLWNWVSKVVPNVDLVSVEILLGGMHGTTFDLAMLHVITAILCKQYQVPLCFIQPSTHYKFVSGIGRYGPAYSEQIRTISALEKITRHEETAIGVAYAALQLWRNPGHFPTEAISFLQQRVTWLIK